MRPRREVHPKIPPDAHRRKQNGNCRKDCKICEKVAYEKNMLEDPNAIFLDLYVCREGGPNETKLDHAGYELDYDKVSDWFKPTDRSSLRPTLSKVERFQQRCERESEEREQMAKMFFKDGVLPEGWHSGPNPIITALRDQVEKDLGRERAPWHKIEVDEVKEWEKKGFEKANKEDYENFSEEDRKRFLSLESGCVYRK